MIEMEVRCCCQPQKLLGYLQVKEPRPGQVAVAFRWYEQPMHFMSMADAFNGVTPPRAKIVSLPLAEIDVEGRRYVAIKAEGMGLKDLRNIPGFRAAA